MVIYAEVVITGNRDTEKKDIEKVVEEYKGLGFNISNLAHIEEEYRVTMKRKGLI